MELLIVLYLKFIIGERDIRFFKMPLGFEMPLFGYANGSLYWVGPEAWPREWWCRGMIPSHMMKANPVICDSTLVDI